MAPRRITTQSLDASLEHDGQRIDCRAGEPLALSLLAAGRTTLSRSAKYHRPRGAMCLRGVCEGCLVRVDGVPDVMACRVAARDGMRVTSQNAFPSASMDLFRVTDWFFPKHMDHHHLMVAMGRTLNDTMQVFARRMAGLGTLPEDPGPGYQAMNLMCEVLVVGAGSSGLSAANALARRGIKVLCVEEEALPGGWLSELPGSHGAVEALDPRVNFLPSHAAVATFESGTLVLSAKGLTRVQSRARLFANGCHESVGTFAQNDLPGVYTARAAMRALRWGVSLGRSVAMVGALPGMSALADALRSAGVRVEHMANSEVLEAHGGRKVSGVTVRGRKKLNCDALVVGLEPLASYELAGQGGAELRWDAPRGCFVPVADASGRSSAPGVYVTGSLRAGFAGDPVARVKKAREDGARAAMSIARDLGEGPGQEASE